MSQTRLSVAMGLARADLLLEQQAWTNGLTLIVCSECGKGHYASEGAGEFHCTNPRCDHTLDWLDLTPEYNEAYDLSNDGRLGYYLKTVVT